MAKPIVLEAPAKLNLYLRVTGRRDDGYHELESLVAFAGFHDVLRMEPADTLKVTVDGPFADALTDPEDNLVAKAARHLAAELGEKPAVRIHITKDIPVAAGLGGGSADAAATLLGLCDLWSVDRSQVDLASIGSRLGADVPVCLFGRPAVMTGVGEKVRGVPTLPEAGLLLVNPGVMIATPDVFGARSGGFSRPLGCPDRIGGLRGLADLLRAGGNDLLGSAVSICPEIGVIVERLADLPGCRYAGMSGSGATCFGLFDDEGAAQRAAEEITHNGWWFMPTSLRSHGPFERQVAPAEEGGVRRPQGR